MDPMLEFNKQITQTLTRAIENYRSRKNKSLQDGQEQRPPASREDSIQLQDEYTHTKPRCHFSVSVKSVLNFVQNKYGQDVAEDEQELTQFIRESWSQLQDGRPGDDKITCVLANNNKLLQFTIPNDFLYPAVLNHIHHAWNNSEASWDDRTVMVEITVTPSTDTSAIRGWVLANTIAASQKLLETAQVQIVARFIHCSDPRERWTQVKSELEASGLSHIVEPIFLADDVVQTFTKLLMAKIEVNNEGELDATDQGLGRIVVSPDSDVVRHAALWYQIAQSHPGYQSYLVIDETKRQFLIKQAQYLLSLVTAQTKESKIQHISYFEQNSPAISIDSTLSSIRSQMQEILSMKSETFEADEESNIIDVTAQTHFVAKHIYTKLNKPLQEPDREDEGVYWQYTHARLSCIAQHVVPEALNKDFSKEDSQILSDTPAAHTLVHLLMRFAPMINRYIASHDPKEVSVFLSTMAFNIGSSISYLRVKGQSVEIQRARWTLLDACRKVVKLCLACLGLESLNRM